MAAGKDTTWRQVRAKHKGGQPLFVKRKRTRGRKFLSSRCLDIAFSLERQGVTARQMHAGEGTVKRCRQTTASAILHYQQDLLQGLAKRLQQSAAPLRCVAVSEAFDETSEHVRLEIPGLEQATGISAWHIMVATTTVHAITAAGQEELLQLVQPPVALLQIDAGSIARGQAIYRHTHDSAHSWMPHRVCVCCICICII